MSAGALGLPLGEALAALLERPPQSPPDAAPDAPQAVEDAALAIGRRTRRVLLDGNWWREPGPPLLAHLREDEQGDVLGRAWVALKPGGSGGYRAVSAGGRPVPVDEALAGRFAPFAYTLHERFPERALGIRDVLRVALAPLRSDLALVLGASLVAALVGLVAPVATGALIDRAIPAGSMTQVGGLIVGVAVAGLAAIALGVVHSIASLRVESRAALGLQAALLDRVIAAPARFFRQFGSGDLSLRLGAVGIVQRTLTEAALGTAIALTFAAANTALLFSYSARLAWAALAVAALVALVIAVIGVARIRVGRRIAEADGRLSSTTFELFTGIAKLRAAAAERRALGQWLGHYRSWRALALRGANLGNLEVAILALLQPMAIVAVLALAWKLAGEPEARGLPIGQFVAFQAALFGTIGGLAALVSTAFLVAGLAPDWERAKPLLEAEPESGNGPGRRRHVPQGAVSLEAVSFAYPGGPPVLADITLDIPAGSFVAIVGASGSGKSTLLRLLLGFEQPDRGVVRYDGHDLAQLDVSRLRRGIGTVLQGGKLWAGDILANISGSHPLTAEDAMRVASAAGLASDIEAMPMGLYTLVGEGVATLSGGQRQRVLIARALAGHPRLLLLDEATSALDNLSQATVLASLAQLKATRIVVAHRLSTVRHADRIVVLEKGRIAQQGTYQELALAPGPFAAMLARQRA